MPESSNSNVRPELTTRYETRFRPLSAGPFHIVTTVDAPQLAQDASRPALNVSFVVDRSGSMAGGKLELVRRGVTHALGLLDRGDTFSLVVYDDRVDVITGQRAARRRYRSEATQALADVQPRGMTALAAGWASGCQQLAAIADGAHEAERPLCRTLLLTDGLANVGETDPAALAAHAAELKARGVATSTFGVGDSFDDGLLGAMADAGGGKYHYIPNAAAIPNVFAGELGELLAIAARDVTLAMRWPDGWEVANLNGLPEERSDGWLRVPLGDLMAGEQRKLAWRCELPAAAPGQLATLEQRLEWRDANGEPQTAILARKEIEAQPDPGRKDQTVLDEVALLIGARAREDAVAHARAGRRDLAREAVVLARQAMPASPAGLAEAGDLDRIAANLDSADEAAYKELNYASRLRRRNQRDYRGTNE